jgi:predicted MFS family arabinose efflux permease
MHCLWSKWSPPFERSRLTTFALSGSYIGTVCAMSLGGIIGKEINWEAIFYIFGTAAIVWSVLWFIFIHESPGDHKSILLEERNFVEASITHVNLIYL